MVFPNVAVIVRQLAGGHWLATSEQFDIIRMDAGFVCNHIVATPRHRGLGIVARRRARYMRGIEVGKEFLVTDRTVFDLLSG